MKDIKTIDHFLVAGIIGLVLILFVAYSQPSTLNDFDLSDISPNGLLSKVGVLLSIAGLLSFFYGIPQSFYILLTNILRSLYAIAFILVSYCSGEDWQCFNHL